MTLDPFTSIGLAANIIQFITFASKLLSEGHEIYKSATGVTAENEELELVVRDLSEISQSLQEATPSSPASSSSSSSSSYCAPEINDLAPACQKVADELLSVVESLRVKEGGTKHRRWHSFVQALRTVWKKEKITALRNRLDVIQKELVVRISFNIQ